MTGGSPVETARAFGYLMPEDLTTLPDALLKLEASDAWTRGYETLCTSAARWDNYSKNFWQKCPGCLRSTYPAIITAVGLIGAPIALPILLPMLNKANDLSDTCALTLSRT